MLYSAMQQNIQVLFEFPNTDGTAGQVLQTDGYANLSFATPSGGTNTPAFLSAQTVNQSVTADTSTLVQYNTEIFDTDSCYNNSTYFFTPNVAGKYFVFATVRLGTSADFNYLEIRIKKNNSTTVSFSNMSHQHFEHLKTFSIVEMNGTTDYLGGYVVHEDTQTLDTDSSGVDFILQFGAYKIIE